MCILGEITDGVMRLSEIGRIVDACWREIPKHFENTRVERFQIMPNHVHGIVEIKEKKKEDRVGTLQGIGRGLINQTPTGDDWMMMKQPRVTLGKIVRSFKARCTRLSRVDGHHSFGWQRNYYDHIIRDDIDHFFVEQYIALNPLMWDLDRDNPRARQMSTDLLRKTLQKEHGLDGMPLERMIDYELSYREWS
jgi:putative transposase